MNCTPVNLSNSAKCFKSCSSQMGIQPIKGYLLCSIFNKGGLKLVGPEVTAWSAQVVANGGAAPSANTLVAANNFVSTMKSAGLWSRFTMVNIFAPDSMVACFTPLIVNSASTPNNPWLTDVALSAVGAACLNLNGYQRDADAGAHTMLTGFDPYANYPSGAIGMSIYISSLAGRAGADGSDMGCVYTFPTNADYYDWIYLCMADTNGTPPGYNFGFTSTSVGAQFGGPISNRSGYYSGNRNNTPINNLYFANNTNAHSTIATNNSALNRQLPPLALAVAGMAGGGSGPYGIRGGSSSRYSYASVHDFFTQSESQTEYNAVVALRTALGGGYTNFLNPDSTTAVMNDWLARVAAAGGATPSAGTQTALATFWNSLISAGLNRMMSFVNPFVPDNLIASITPFYKISGYDSWINHGFVAGDLKPAGLKGDGVAKYLETGFLPAYLQDGLRGGCAIYCATAYTTSTASRDMSSYGPSATNSTTIGFSPIANNVGWSGGNYSDHWVTVSNAGPFLGILIGTVGSAGGNHVSLYSGNSSVGINLVAGNANGPYALSPQPLYVFAENGNGTAGSFSDHRLSFAAGFNDMVSTQVTAFYNAVQALRVAFGAGYV